MEHGTIYPWGRCFHFRNSRLNYHSLGPPGMYVQATSSNPAHMGHTTIFQVSPLYENKLEGLCGVLVTEARQHRLLSFPPQQWPRHLAAGNTYSFWPLYLPFLHWLSQFSQMADHMEIYCVHRESQSSMLTPALHPRVQMALSFLQSRPLISLSNSSTIITCPWAHSNNVIGIPGNFINLVCSYCNSY